MKRPHPLMASREAQGLQLVALVRLAYGLAFAPGDLAFVRSRVDFVYWLVSLVLFVGINLVFIHLLRRRKLVDVIGVTGAILDVLMIGIGVVVWSNLTGSHQTLWTQRSLLPLAAMVTIAINGLALRPRYPLILSIGILLIMTGSLVLGLRDPLTTLSDGFVELTPAPGELSLFLYLGSMLLILVCGAVTVLLTVLSRKTVHKAVQLERVNIALAESQADVVIEQKIAALTELAAGLSHELNNPLGAMSSTAATTSRLAARVRDILTTESGLELKDNRKLWRTLDSLEASAKVAQEAGHRILEVAETLRQFIRLDESERKRANLAQMLDETLGLLQHQLGQRIEVKKRYANVPAVDCYPRRLNQVFYTLIRKAAESIEGQGSIAITLETVEQAVQLQITDSGRGIAAERLAHLFEIELRPEQSRVRAAMDLAICRSIVQKHGGRIAAESNPGQGTTFCITLPVSASPALA